MKTITLTSSTTVKPPWPRRWPHHGLDMEFSSRTSAGVASTARAGVEMTRYRAYQAYLAGHTVGETFGRATAFLKLAGANAPSITETSAISLTDVSAHAAR